MSEAVDVELDEDGDRLLHGAGWVAAILLPAAALIYLSFNAGGFFPSSPGFAAIIFVQALVVRTMVARRPYEGLDRRLAVPIVALALFGAWQLASALWSHATARAIDEYDRTLLYLLAFVLFGSMAASTTRLRWLIRALAAAIATVCVIALISRLLPATWPTALGLRRAALSYPLTYWNADGLLAALGLILCFHLTCDGREYRIVRVLAAALMPAIAAMLLLTFSRGPIGVAVLGLLIYAVLAHPRALPTGVISVAPAVAIALRSTYDATLLASNDPTSPAAIVQGQHVARVVGLSMLLAAVLRLVMLLPDDWLARRRFAFPARSGAARAGVLVGTGLVLIVALIAAGAPGFVSHQYHRFVNSAGPSGTLTRQRLTDPSNDSRLPLWKVGMQAFRAQPLHGQGAGTFQLYFAQHRPNVPSVVDAHSLYVQTLAELGIVGLVLLLVALVGILGLLAARIRGPDRAVYAALFAVGIAWAVHAGVDWDWQMPAITLWLFAAAGLALGRRPATSQEQAGEASWDRTSVAVVWLALAVAPLLVTLSFQRVQAAGQALSNLDCSAARRDALSSLSYDAVRPEPYALIGFCDLRQGYGAASVAAMQKAVSYEPGNWQYYYALALARAEDGQNPAPTLRRAQSLNPYESIIGSAAATFAHAGPRRWAQVAASVSFQGLDSGELSGL